MTVPRLSQDSLPRLSGLDFRLEIQYYTYSVYRDPLGAQKVMKGTPLIVLDPVKTELARFANWHIQLRPGTNVAVLNMMAHFIIEAGLVDENFVQTRTEEYKDYAQAIMALDIDELAAIAGVDKRTSRNDSR